MAFGDKKIDVEEKRREIRDNRKKVPYLAEEKIPLKTRIKNLYKKLVSTKVSVPNSKYYKSKVPRFCYMVTQSNLFITISFTLIIVNTLILSIDRYPSPAYAEELTLRVINNFIFCVFAIELILKIVAVGIKSFVRERANLFETLIVLMSFFEIIYYKGVSIYTTLRVLRIFSILRSFNRWESMKLLIDSIMHTISAIGNFTILLSLFIYIYSLLGM